MASENIAAFLLLYAKPVAAIGRILDRGRLWFAICVAVGVALLLSAVHVRETWRVLELASVQQQGEGADGPDLRVARPASDPGSRVYSAARNWVEARGLIAPLAGLALAFIPAIIAIRGFSGFGSFGVLMRNDYLSLLMCGLFIWSAAYLPVGLSALVMPLPWLSVLAQICLVAGTALSVRTSMGTTFPYALGITAGAWCLTIAAMALYEVTGPLHYYVMSPFLLYYGYSLFRSDFSALGDGLRSRQHLQSQLEVATNNPRDADAHYQLGLIYQKRRQFTEASARFQRAIEIDPKEGDAHLQLGRIALAQNRAAEAIQSLEMATKIDDKLSSSEGLRDLGIAYFQASRAQDAAAVLTKYADRRPYDPEGLFWLGRAFAALGDNKQARERFTECVEAVNTSPKHRKPYVKQWATQAKTAMKTLPA